MRVTLKHLLPLALLLGNVIAATETGSDNSGTTAVTATDEATSTAKAATTATGKNTATVTSGAKGSGTKATGTATGTDEENSTATGTDNSQDATTTSTTTTQRFNTDEWIPTIPATAAPDLNAGVSLKDPGFVGLSVAFGLVTIGMAFL